MAQTVKGLPTIGRPRFDPWVGKILWRRKWQPTPVLLPGKSHGWRSLVGYSPWGHKEMDSTEQFHFTSVALRRSKVLRIIVLDTIVSYSDRDRQITAQIHTCFTKRGTKSTEILGLPSKSEEYYFSIVTYVLVAQSCLTLCDLMDCSPPGSSVHGILQARILGWVAIPFFRRSS